MSLSHAFVNFLVKISSGLPAISLWTGCGRNEGRGGGGDENIKQSLAAKGVRSCFNISAPFVTGEFAGWRSARITLETENSGHSRSLSSHSGHLCIISSSISRIFTSPPSFLRWSRMETASHQRWSFGQALPSFVADSPGEKWKPWVKLKSDNSWLTMY